jgi:hypothetical protein
MGEQSEEIKYDDKAPWYHWVAAFAIMAAGAAFIVIPEKPLWLGIAIIAVGYGSVQVIGRLPREKPKDL